MNKHKAMRIHNRICQNIKKLFVTVNPINACRMKFDYHLWVTFIAQPKSDAVVFVIIYFKINKNLVTEWKHGIYTNNIITFNKVLENLSTSIA